MLAQHAAGHPAFNLARTGRRPTAPRAPRPDQQAASAPLPDNVYPALPGSPGNVAAILADQRAVAYVEGLALLPDLQTVIEHAWCSTFTGQVIEPNLQGQSAAAYLGAAFAVEFRCATLTRTGGTRPILISDPAGNPTPNLDILEHGLAPETILEIGRKYDRPRTPSPSTARQWPQWPTQDTREGARSARHSGPTHPGPRRPGLGGLRPRRNR